MMNPKIKKKNKIKTSILKKYSQAQSDSLSSNEKLVGSTIVYIDTLFKDLYLLLIRRVNI